MIVDTSAVISILFDEHEAEQFDEAIVNAPHCLMSVVNYLETAMVLEGRRGVPAGLQLDAYLEAAAIALAPVTVEQAQAARCGVAAIRQGESSGGTELWRLLRLRPGGVDRRAAAVQGSRLCADRY